MSVIHIGKNRSQFLLVNYTCTTCFKVVDQPKVNTWNDKQVCGRCYFKYIKYQKLQSDTTDEERKQVVLDLLGQMEGKKYGNDV